MIVSPVYLCLPTARPALYSALTAGQTTTGSPCLFSCPALSACVCIFCCVSVLGKMPADHLLLLTASTSAPPDLGETVIVSASALNGSAGWFQSTQTCLCLPLFLSGL